MPWTDVAPKFEQVVKEVREKIKGKIVVGHALFNDLAVSPFALL
jgi:DNA polymerase III epsilon subunit-like protein